MSFGFSTGDFIAALNLIQGAIDAISSSHGSSAQYRSLLRELYALESALLRVKSLELDASLDSEKRALEQAASLCQRDIDEFLTRIREYQPHLRAGGSGDGMGAKAKDAWMKIKWAKCREDDVDRFKAVLMGHSGSISRMLHTTEVKNTTLQSQRQEQQQGRLVGLFQTASSSVFSSVTSVSGIVSRCLQQGHELLEITKRIMDMNFRMFSMIRDIHNQLPPQIQRDQPVSFTNVFGRTAPFHLEFITSAQHLLAVIRVELEAAGAGTHWIDFGLFLFEDLATGRYFDITENWHSCLRPGQQIAMSLGLRKLIRDSIGPDCRIPLRPSIPDNTWFEKPKSNSHMNYFYVTSCKAKELLRVVHLTKYPREIILRIVPRGHFPLFK
ncbi:hypothetical protein P280DRAFT_553318 [Massarina eburnea CBS 473.64]|uniref:Ubiquitin-like domain-containing protein n=1 Tax=Massarina eburnea CBS 473.64 TaxID=1395130 RepID=A0A6A6RKU9_9PLEO|nr:hypothetical protein P280DRAFT_553318 [Massarina eburnea CBS 473.64]